MAPEPTGEAAVPATPATSLSQRLAAEESVEEQHRILRELVLTHVSSILGHVTPDTIDGSRAFKELGFDSLAAVDFRNHLSSSVGLTLPTTLTFDHPTPLAVAGFLRSQLLDEDGGDSSSVSAVVGGVGVGVDWVSDPVVIVGMSCRLPGGVSSPGELWRLLAEGG
ncbi:phosphopantetheine-binding protein, partial [Streptomyces sp. 2MCAF27]